MWLSWPISTVVAPRGPILNAIVSKDDMSYGNEHQSIQEVLSHHEPLQVEDNSIGNIICKHKIGIQPQLTMESRNLARMDSGVSDLPTTSPDCHNSNYSSEDKRATLPELRCEIDEEDVITSEHVHSPHQMSLRYGDETSLCMQQRFLSEARLLQLQTLEPGDFVNYHPQSKPSYSYVGRVSYNRAQLACVISTVDLKNNSVDIYDGDITIKVPIKQLSDSPFSLTLLREEKLLEIFNVSNWQIAIALQLVSNEIEMLRVLTLNGNIKPWTVPEVTAIFTMIRNNMLSNGISPHRILRSSLFRENKAAKSFLLGIFENCYVDGYSASLLKEMERVFLLASNLVNKWGSWSNDINDRSYFDLEDNQSKGSVFKPVPFVHNHTEPNTEKTAAKAVKKSSKAKLSNTIRNLPSARAHRVSKIRSSCTSATSIVSSISTATSITSTDSVPSLSLSMSSPSKLPITTSLKTPETKSCEALSFDTVSTFCVDTSPSVLGIDTNGFRRDVFDSPYNSLVNSDLIDGNSNESSNDSFDSIDSMYSLNSMTSNCTDIYDDSPANLIATIADPSYEDSFGVGTGPVSPSAGIDNVTPRFEYYSDPDLVNGIVFIEGYQSDMGLSLSMWTADDSETIVTIKKIKSDYDYKPNPLCCLHIGDRLISINDTMLCDLSSTQIHNLLQSHLNVDMRSTQRLKLMFCTDETQRKNMLDYVHSKEIVDSLVKDNGLVVPRAINYAQECNNIKHKRQTIRNSIPGNNKKLETFPFRSSDDSRNRITKPIARKAKDTRIIVEFKSMTSVPDSIIQEIRDCIASIQNKIDQFGTSPPSKSARCANKQHAACNFDPDLLKLKIELGEVEAKANLYRQISIGCFVFAKTREMSSEEYSGSVVDIRTIRYIDSEDDRGELQCQICWDISHKRDWVPLNPNFIRLQFDMYNIESNHRRKSPRSFAKW